MRAQLADGRILEFPDGTDPMVIQRTVKKMIGAPQTNQAGIGRYDTHLTPQEETEFAEWKRINAPDDSGADYDLRGAFKAKLQPVSSGHWPDTYKKPNHPTFSDESIYARARPDLAGHWEGDRFVPPTPAKTAEPSIGGFLKASMPQAAAIQASSHAPGSEPLPPFSDMLKELGLSAGRGLITGGPLGAMIETGSTGLKNQGKLMDRLAYRAGAGVTDALAPHVPAEIAGGAGYAANVAIQAVPVLTGAILGQSVTKPAMRGAGERLMQSALKPLQKDVASGNATRAIRTLLDEGASVTSGGSTKLRGIAGDMNRQVESILNPLRATVDRSRPADEVVDLLMKNAQQATPSQAEKAITAAWDDFVASHPNIMTVQQAQKVKQATYKALDDAYLGENTSSSEAAQKAIARGLKKAIEEIAPGVKLLNQRSSDVLNAARQVERRVGMAANRDLVGLSPAGMNPAAMAAMLMDRSPWLKSLVARMLYSGAGPASTLLGAGAGSQIGLLSGSPLPGSNY